MRVSKLYPKTILVLPDIHYPWPHQAGIEMAHKWAIKHKPDLVIQLGDIMDQKAWSRWPGATDDPSPEDEFERAYQGMVDLGKRFKKMEVLIGNHDRRVMMKAAESKLPSRMIKTIQEMIPNAGWNWRTDPRKKLIVPSPRGDILFVHGDENGGTPIQKAVLMGINVMSGHTHKTSLSYRETMGKFVWGMECGHLMDSNSKAADYAAASGIGSTAGFGVIKHGIPYWIPADGGTV